MAPIKTNGDHLRRTTIHLATAEAFTKYGGSLRPIAQQFGVSKSTPGPNVKNGHKPANDRRGFKPSLTVLEEYVNDVLI